MQSLMVVRLAGPPDALPGFRDCPVITQVDLLVFQRAPQPLDKDVVQSPPLPIHADRHTERLQLPSEALAGERRSLIAVEDLRSPAVD